MKRTGGERAAEQLSADSVSRGHQPHDSNEEEEWLVRSQEQPQTPQLPPPSQAARFTNIHEQFYEDFRKFIF